MPIRLIASIQWGAITSAVIALDDNLAEGVCRIGRAFQLGTGKATRPPPSKYDKRKPPGNRVPEDGTPVHFHQGHSR